MMAALFPELRFIAADPDFVNLHILQGHFGGPAITPICIDAEFPLPFQDEQFSAVFCLDAFHYIRSKSHLAAEFRRVTEEEGPLLIPHVHNRLRPNPAPGFPLSAADYARLFGADTVLRPESAVLDDFVREGTFDLSGADSGNLELAEAFTLVSCPAPLRRKYDAETRLLHACREGLSLNPAFHAETVGKSVRFRRALPNTWLRAECSAMEQYLPSDVDLDEWHRIRSGTWLAEDEAVASSLIRRLVVTPAPKRR
jgi:hypothetical protein